MAAINRDQFDVRFLSCNKWVRCASCESAERQLVRGRLISQSGRLRNQIFGSLLGSLLGSLSGHFLPHSFPCLPQQAPPITSKMAPMVIALFYLAAQIPSGLLCASPQPDWATTLSPKDDQNPLAPLFPGSPKFQSTLQPISKVQERGAQVWARSRSGCGDAARATEAHHHHTSSTTPPVEGPRNPLNVAG